MSEEQQETSKFSMHTTGRSEGEWDPDRAAGRSHKRTWGGEGAWSRLCGERPGRVGRVGRVGTARPAGCVSGACTWACVGKFKRQQEETRPLQTAAVKQRERQEAGLSPGTVDRHPVTPGVVKTLPSASASSL